MIRRVLLLATLGIAVAGASSMAWSIHPRTAGALTNCDTSTAALDASELKVIADINAFRAENGLPPLKISPNLSRAAAFMVDDMLAKNYFSHTDSLGRSAFARAKQCGYTIGNVGENLAMGFGAPASGGESPVVSAWRESKKGHREAMLSPTWTVIGVGFAGGYWAADFGSFDDSASGGTAPPTATQPVATTTAGQSYPTATATATKPAPTATPTVSPTPIPTPPPIQRRAAVPMIASE